MHVLCHFLIIPFLKLLNHLVITNNPVCGLHIFTLHLVNFRNCITHGTFLF